MVKITDIMAVPESKKPTIMVPPRGQMDSLFTNGLSGLGFSPGPMTLVSGFFSEQGSAFSFSQLLAGTMVSPVAASKGSGEDEKSSDDEMRNGQELSGYKRNRPVNLVVAQPQIPLDNLSPLFLIPPGLSPSGLLTTPTFLSPIQSPFGMSHQQALSHVTAQAAFSQSYMQMQSRLQLCSATESIPAQTVPQKTITLQPEPEKVKIEQPPEASDKKLTSSSQKPADDGYNWRKYGEKQVKGSECPRSYYKCSHPNCPVKKKVERSNDGNISEITYKGRHNHDPPQNSRRGKEMDRTHQSQQIDSDSESLNTITIADDDNADDEPIAKRSSSRAVADSVPFRQTVKESKIVVQTRSEVDLLDDGYKWRKYGQKMVKGSRHPRSYYKCTYSGCNVRKHVERSPSDPMAVITTYEGKHEHELPMGRSSSSSSNRQLYIENKDE